MNRDRKCCHETLIHRDVTPYNIYDQAGNVATSTDSDCALHAILAQFQA